MCQLHVLTRCIVLAYAYVECKMWFLGDNKGLCSVWSLCQNFENFNTKMWFHNNRKQGTGTGVSIDTAGIMKGYSFCVHF